MNRFHFLLVIYILGITGCNEADTLEEIVERSNAQTDKIRSLEYDIDYRIKHFTSEDTTQLLGHCSFELDEADTALGFRTKIVQERGYEHIYDSENLYVVNHKEKKVIILDPKTNGLGYFTGNIVENLVFDHLLEGIDLDSLLADTIGVSLLSEEETDTLWAILLSYPEGVDFKGMFETLWLSKSSHLPVKMKFRAQLQDMHYYTELSLSKIRINQAETVAKIKDLDWPSDYISEYPDPPSDSEFELLAIGSEAPKFKMQDLSGQDVNLTDYRGKLVLLDFWYMSCFPCIKALPHMQELHEKFGDQGLVVLGVNAHDNKEKRRERIPEFLSKRAIDYPCVLADRSVDSLYQVQAYPSIYLIDQNGKVVFTQIGFSSAIGDSLAAKISELL